MYRKLVIWISQAIITVHLKIIKLNNLRLNIFNFIVYSTM